MLKEQHLQKIQKIEKAVYPEYMCYLGDCDNKKEVAEYMECKPREIFYMLGDNYYLLAAIKKDFIEIVDLASTGPMNIFKILNTLETKLKGKKIIMDARKETSYPIIILLLKRKKIKLLKDEIWDWDGEEMHYLEFIL